MLIITNNNLLVEEYLKKTNFKVKYIDGDVLSVMKTVRDYVHEGARLLSHPLSGSIKPNENPYKSIAVDLCREDVLDFESLEIIEKSILTVEKFLNIGLKHSGIKEKSDYELIDLTLMDSALRR